VLDDSLMKRTPLANWRFAQLMHTWLRGSRKGPNKRWLRRRVLWGEVGRVQWQNVVMPRGVPMHIKNRLKTMR